MDYDGWNKALTDRLFAPASKDRQVFVNVTPDLLQEVLQTLGQSTVSTEEASADFCRAVVAKSRRDICKRTWEWSQDDDWKAGRLPDPPYLGFLAVFVLALTYGEDSLATKKGAGYYSRLNDLLRRHGYVGEAADSSAFAHTKAAWQDLEFWSSVTQGKRRGYYKFRQVGGWVHVGMPVSQALVQSRDYEKIEELFHTYSRNLVLKQAHLERDLTANPYKYLTGTTAGFLSGEDKEIKQEVLKLLLEFWDEYRVRPPKIRLKSKRHAVPVPPAAGSSKPATEVTVLIASFQDFDTGRDLLCAVLQLIGTESPPEELIIERPQSPWTASRFRVDGDLALFGPVIRAESDQDIVELSRFMENPGPFTARADGHDYGTFNAEALAQPLTFLQQEDETSGSPVEWLELDSDQIQSGGYYRVIAKGAAEKEAALAFLTANGVTDPVHESEANFSSLPAEWRIFTIRLASQSSLEVSNTPPGDHVIRCKPVGGIRSCAGNSNTYLWFAPPSFVRTGVGGIAAISEHGKRELQRRDNQNGFTLPVALRQPGWIRLRPTNVEGNDEPQSEALMIELQGPSMPGEVTRFPVNPFRSDPSTARSGAAFYNVQAPEFLFNPKAISISLEGGEPLEGRKRAYKPGRLPVASLNGENARLVTLTCDGRLLQPASPNRYDLSSGNLGLGPHTLQALWHGAPTGGPVEFHVTDVPIITFTIVGATKLQSGTHAPQEEYLVESESGWFDFEPSAHVSGWVGEVAFPSNGHVKLSDALAKSDCIQISLKWKNIPVVNKDLAFIRKPPVVQINVEGAPGIAAFPRHKLHRLSVFVEGGHHGEIKLFCGTRECDRAAEPSIFNLPNTLPSGTALRISAQWRGVPIPCKSPSITIEDPPVAHFRANGGKRSVSGAYFFGRLPSLALTGQASAPLEVSINDKPAALDASRIVSNLSSLAVIGHNRATALWHGEEIDSFPFTVIAAPSTPITLQGGASIGPDEFVMCGPASLPDVICSAPGPLLCNGHVLEGGQLLPEHCNHGPNEIRLHDSPEVKRFTLWKDFEILGAEEGQIATYNGSRPPWLPVWAIAKFKREVKAAPLPGGADTPPHATATAPKKAKQAWRDKFRDAVLVANQPAHRTLWKQYQQMCRR